MPSARKLWVGQDLVVDALFVVGQDLLNGLCGLDRDSGLINIDLVGVGHVGNHPGCALPVGEVGSLAGSQTAGLGGGVHRDKDDVGLSDVLLDVGAEEEVLAPARLDNIIEAGLVDREGVVVPGVNAGLGDVDNHHLNCWALDGNDNHCWAADVANSYAADLHHLGCLSSMVC